MYHGDEAADRAREHFEKTVVRKELPDDVPPFHVPPSDQPVTVTKVLVLLGWAASNREAQRLVAQGAIKIDGARIDDAQRAENSWHGKVIQKGNHQFARLT
jgi:tyrosyl-tRNA synthetase